jgi:hypothetical protein
MHRLVGLEKKVDGKWKSWLDGEHENKNDCSDSGAVLCSRGSVLRVLPAFELPWRPITQLKRQSVTSSCTGISRPYVRSTESPAGEPESRANRATCRRALTLAWRPFGLRRCGITQMLAFAFGTISQPAVFGAISHIATHFRGNNLHDYRPQQSRGEL